MARNKRRGKMHSGLVSSGLSDDCEQRSQRSTAQPSSTCWKSSYLWIPLLVAGCGMATSKNSGASQQQPVRPVVTVATPLVRSVIDWDDYIGKFEAVETVQLRPRVSGYLQSIRFRDGQFVRKGDLLFTIDPRPFQASLDQAKADERRAEAAAEVARSVFSRSEKLLQIDAVSREEYENARSAFQQAQAQLATAHAVTAAKALDVGYTNVTAPVSGRLSDRRISAGNYVTSGETVLTTIVSLDPIYFVFTGSETVYLKYQRANQAGTRPSSRLAPNPVDIRIADESRYNWRGHMDFVDNAIDSNSGTIRGRAVVRNPQGLLTPGLFGHLRLLGSGAYDGFLIPEAAIVTDQTRKVALVVGPDGKILQKILDLGPIVDGLRAVRSGLQRSDKVVITGLQRARPGAAVSTRIGKIVPPDPGSAPRLPDLIEPPATSATDAAVAH